MSELRITTSRRGSVARRPRLTLAAKPSLRSAVSSTSMPRIRRSAARCSAPLQSSETITRAMPLRTVREMLRTSARTRAASR